MDGIASGNSKVGSVMVLAATNCPWHLDQAILRRLEKRIYIPLPDLLGRAEMFRLHLRDVEAAEDLQVSSLARLTQNYTGKCYDDKRSDLNGQMFTCTGSDIKNVCREAAMMPMRRIIVGL